jgi:heat shock protein HtpX
MDWSTDRTLTARMAATLALLVAFGVALSAFVGTALVATGFGVVVLLAADPPLWALVAVAGIGVVLVLPLLAVPLSRTTSMGTRREMNDLVADWHGLVEKPMEQTLHERVLKAVFLTVYVVGLFVFVVPRGFLSAVSTATLGAPGAIAGTTAAVFLALTAFELRLSRRMVSVSGAFTVDASTHPRLDRITTAVAKAYDLPMPELAVVDTDTPEAFVVGFTPARSTMAVSTGLLDRLHDEELRAVVAHELAHVRNHDAAVMTAATGPLAVADFLYESAGQVLEFGERSALAPQAFSTLASVSLPVVFGLGWLFRGIGAALVASFSRTRELAADRAAAVVTGDGSSLASALVSINDAIRDRPAEDLRASESLSAMTIISPSSVSDGPIELGAEGEDEAYMLYYEELLRERVFGTHPPVGERVRRLGDLEGSLERRSVVPAE